MRVAERDVGLGTAYERWAIYRRLDRWFPAAPATALEGPLDGMAGMPGLHLLGLALRGTHVTLVHADPAALLRARTIYGRAGIGDRLETIRAASLPSERRFDLVLGFNFAPLTKDWRAHLAGLARASCRELVVFATHPRSYGVAIRRALRRLEAPRGPELFEHESCQPTRMRAELTRAGEVLDEKFVDCPWWPDLFVEAGQTLGPQTLRRLRPQMETPSEPARTRYDWGPARFPFVSERTPGALRWALFRHPHFESAPSALAGAFAHHRAYRVIIAENGSAGRGGVR